MKEICIHRRLALTAQDPRAIVHFTEVSSIEAERLVAFISAADAMRRMLDPVSVTAGQKLADFDRTRAALEVI